MGKENFVELKIQVDSASPVSFLKRNIDHELKLRDSLLKINTVDQATKDLQQGFTCDPIKIVGQVIVPIRSIGRTYETTIFFITEANERNILGNGNLPNVRIEVAQKPFPQYKNNIGAKSFINSVGLYESETETIFRNFNKLFDRIGNMRNKLKITLLHDPLKPVQLKGRRVPLHLLPAVSKKLDRLISEGHIKNLESRDEVRFISTIVITCKKEKSIKLALDSKFLKYTAIQK